MEIPCIRQYQLELKKTKLFLECVDISQRNKFDQKCYYSPPSGSELQLSVVIFEPSQDLPPYIAGLRIVRFPILIPLPHGAEQFPNVNSPHSQSTVVY